MGIEEVILYALIAVALAAAAAAFLLRPKGPPPPPPSTLDDLNVPVAEEGGEIPVIFGTVDLEGQNIVWYGHFKTDPIKKKAGK